MSGFEINKIVGAILSAALVTMVISLIGNALVHPKQHTASVHVPEAAATHPAAEPKKELPIAQRLPAAKVAVGAKIFNKCKSCHNADKGGKNKIGPNLWNVVGNNRAAHPGFSYSQALKGLGGKWSYEDLDKFLTNPGAFAKGTKMTFAGLRNGDERADVIAYLRTLSDSPKPLP